VTGTTAAPEQFQPEHVEFLPRDVLRPHVHRAAQAQVRGYRRRGDPVLARARLRDQRSLADPLGQQPLAQRVVDLVAAGVGEILALEQHPHAQRLGQAGRLGDRGRPASVGALQAGQPGPEARVGPGRPESRLELLARRHQRLRDETPAE
jgi:hypothetical protein